MKKPKKKEVGEDNPYSDGLQDGYNQACDDWEKYHKPVEILARDWKAHAKMLEEHIKRLRLSEEDVRQVVDKIYHLHSVPGLMYSFMGDLANAICELQRGKE